MAELTMPRLSDTMQEGTLARGLLTRISTDIVGHLPAVDPRVLPESSSTTSDSSQSTSDQSASASDPSAKSEAAPRSYMSDGVSDIAVELIPS